jgi:hypothetical protein
MPNLGTIMFLRGDLDRYMTRNIYGNLEYKPMYRWLFLIEDHPLVVAGEKLDK